MIGLAQPANVEWLRIVVVVCFNVWVAAQFARLLDHFSAFDVDVQISATIRALTLLCRHGSSFAMSARIRSVAVEAITLILASDAAAFTAFRPAKVISTTHSEQMLSWNFVPRETKSGREEFSPCAQAIVDDQALNSDSAPQSQ